MGKIYFRTSAYNAEKTIRRCVDSILNQTYRSEDVVLYICDNGSTDGTYDILKDYAEKDSRVVLFRNKKNHVWEGEENRPFMDMTVSLKEDDYFCALDADDSYELNFLEEIIPFLEENNLDIAVCGSNYISAEKNSLLGKRCFENNLLLLNSAEFSDRFEEYHAFMRTVWGKVYNKRAAAALGFFNHLPEERRSLKNQLDYGCDTFLAFSALREAERVGFYKGILHNYYISSKSTSYQYSENRIYSDKILYDDALDFLNKKCGQITMKNHIFVQMVYQSALNDTIKVIVNSDASGEQKLHDIFDIFSDERTLASITLEQYAEANCVFVGVRKHLFDFAINFFKDNIQYMPQEKFLELCYAAELMSATVENAELWLFFKKRRINYYVIKNMFHEARELLDELLE